MTDINVFTITGRLTKDAESKSTTSGSTVVLFTTASNYYKKGADKNEEVSFFDCVSYRADRLLPFLKKGSQVCISGMLRQRRWESNGSKQSRVELVASDIKLIGSKPAERPSNGPEDFPDDDFDFS